MTNQLTTMTARRNHIILRAVELLGICTANLASTPDIFGGCITDEERDKMIARVAGIIVRVAICSDDEWESGIPVRTDAEWNDRISATQGR